MLVQVHGAARVTPFVVVPVDNLHDCGVTHSGDKCLVGIAEEAFRNASALRYGSAQVTLLDLTVLTELGWAGEIHRKNRISVLLCRLLLDLWHQLGALFVEEGTRQCHIHQT